MIETVAYTAVPYSIQPMNRDEALHGKAILLTDCEIAALLKALPKVEAEDVDCDEALTHLWAKLFGVWQQNVPNVAIQ